MSSTASNWEQATASAAGFRLNKMLVATMQAERENRFWARHDALTSLPNRAGLAEAMNARRSGRAALLHLDLDGFKAVNATHGHETGDELLRAVADRLRGATRPNDVVARIGGDEFVILTDDLSPAALKAFSERLIAQISLSYLFSCSRVATISVSIGLGLTPEHGSDIAGLLAAADAALYRAKALGKSRCAFAPLSMQ
ncbi:GGDEF domain-containing protein [Methylobacterium soli]|uniref:GGDEF domain-containing protein n=1 Tax=Methylobacterium soli TaxID=553447 RepID=UPI001EE19A1E|nr:GGDEF domain-containing protein [Methylobacterium soli]